MSAFFASATVTFLFILLLQLVKNKFIAFISALVFAFTGVFWSQSVISEVYTLNSFFLVLIFYLIIRWSKTKNVIYLYFFSFLFGLSLTNHQEMLLLAPALIAFILISEKGFWKRYKTIIMLFLLFIIGLSVYLYLPIRSAANPPIDWGNPESFTNFISHVTRAQYGEGIIASLTNGGKILFLGNFLVQLVQQFSFLVVIGLLGLFSLYFKEKKIFILLAIGFAINCLGVVFLRKIDWAATSVYILRVLYIPCFLIFSLFIASGLEFLWRKITHLSKKSQFRKFILVTIAVLIIVFLPLFFMIVNFNNNDRSRDYLVYDLSSNLLDSLPPNAVLVVYESGFNSDNIQFSLAYLKIVENRRPDVLFITLSPIYGTSRKISRTTSDAESESVLYDLLKQVKEKYSQPIFTTFSVDQVTDSNLFSRSNGSTFEYFSDWETWKKEPPTINMYYLRNIVNQNHLSSDPFTQDFVGSYHYRLAHFWLDHGYLERSKEELLKALSYDPKIQSFSYRGFVVHRANYLSEFKI